jgi:hypothetical protein
MKPMAAMMSPTAIFKLGAHFLFQASAPPPVLISLIPTLLQNMDTTNEYYELATLRDHIEWRTSMYHSVGAWLNYELHSALQGHFIVGT